MKEKQERLYRLNLANQLYHAPLTESHKLAAKRVMEKRNTTLAGLTKDSKDEDETDSDYELDDDDE